MSFRRAVPVLIVAALALGVAWAHCLLFSRHHLASGDAAAAAGDAESARLEWETAASRPAPLNGYAREAMGRLITLEESLERQGRTAEALRVCFSVRGIANAAAGLWPWYRAERDLSTARIEALSRDPGVRFGPDRFTLFRPVRAWAAFGALASFAGLLELGAPGGAPHGPSGPPLATEEAIRQIRASLEEAAAAGSFSGAVLLARDGKTLLRQAWGQADRATGAPLVPETRFNVASIGKIPTRIALAQLAQAGKLSLDDRLSKYMPDFPRASDITLDMVAEHRSGVGDFFNERYEAMDRSKLRHNRDYLQLIGDQPLWFEPGTQRRYSNGGAPMARAR